MLMMLIAGLCLVAVGGVSYVVLRNGRSLTTKLVALSMAIGLGSIIVVAVVSLESSSRSTESLQSEALLAVVSGRRSQVNDYLQQIREQMVNFSKSRTVIEATSGFAQAFDLVAFETALDASDGSPIYRSVAGYYDQEFRPRLEAADQPYRGAAQYIPASEAGRILQSFYISDNPHGVGEKLDLDRAPQSSTYNDLHARYHPEIRRFLNSFGYYDIFLFDTEGNLIYSVYKETDFATSFIDGPYRDSNFGRVVRSALAASEGSLVIEDFAFYEPSYGAPASFIGAPVFDDGERVGVAVFQMPVDNINAMMTEHDGLGDTGQTYLVGADGAMRSQDRFDTENNTILTKTITSAAIDRAASGESAVVTHDVLMDSKPGFAAFAPIEFEGLNWAVIAEKNLSEVNAPARATAMNILISAFVLAGIVGVIAWIFSTRLIKPVLSLVTLAEAIAAGDLSGKELKAQSQDEFGKLTLSTNKMLVSLRDLVTQMTQTSNEVASASTEIDANASQMSHGMEEQNQQVQQIASAIDEMSASAGEVARRAVEASESALNSGESARRGGEVVTETVRGMRGIASAVSSGAESVAELGRRGEEIGQVIAVINDIADQTNLLALNAAIEAARAGEHGRGFAVVADEVRKLADRTTKATQEIGQSINAIQSETQEAVQKMSAGTDQVEQGVQRASAAGQSLSEIVESSEKVEVMIQSIASAAQEQSAAAEFVQENATRIAEVSGRAASGANEAAQAAGQLSDKAELLKGLCQRFSL